MDKTIIGVFTSRVAPGFEAEFETLYKEMSGHIAKIPGYRGHKVFKADDGEGLVLVEFDGEASFESWDEHPDHKRAKERGKLEVFSEYDAMAATVFERHKKPKE